MKKYFLCLFFFQIQAFAANELIERNEANCQKIDGYGQYDVEAIASHWKVPISSVEFVRAEWGTDRTGYRTCIMIFDTQKGPKRCIAVRILTSDNGKTAFGLAVMERTNNPLCF
jgi:hypothetical protein